MEENKEVIEDNKPKKKNKVLIIVISIIVVFLLLIVFIEGVNYFYYYNFPINNGWLKIDYEMGDGCKDNIVYFRNYININRDGATPKGKTKLIGKYNELTAFENNNNVYVFQKGNRKLYDLKIKSNDALFKPLFVELEEYGPTSLNGDLVGFSTDNGFYDIRSCSKIYQKYRNGFKQVKNYERSRLSFFDSKKREFYIGDGRFENIMLTDTIPEEYGKIVDVDAKYLDCCSFMLVTFKTTGSTDNKDEHWALYLERDFSGEYEKLITSESNATYRVDGTILFIDKDNTTIKYFRTGDRFLIDPEYTIATTKYGTKYTFNAYLDGNKIFLCSSDDKYDNRILITIEEDANIDLENGKIISSSLTYLDNKNAFNFSYTYNKDGKDITNSYYVDVRNNKSTKK